jgi:hypothetical protein
MTIDLTDIEYGGQGAAHPTLLRVTTGRLVDQLELVQWHAWVERRGRA